jgi:putative colanic acid biosysnthesis UDP-glucose lipid carrier transferase
MSNLTKANEMETISPQHIEGFSLRSDNKLVAKSFFKRLLDISISAPVLLFLMPAFLVIALLIKIESRGPVFFLQRRTGLNGRIFHIYKFRSMTVTEDGAKVTQAKKDDKRVTIVGKVIRKTSVDELPQLINILIGDMSLVGPRPHALSHDAEFANIVPEYYHRTQTRPGLTGLAAIRGYRGEVHDAECLKQRIKYDIEYIDSWSIWLDIQIILCTVPMVFSDKNAY